MIRGTSMVKTNSIAYTLNTRPDELDRPDTGAIENDEDNKREPDTKGGKATT
jgi:hypothetical protein